MEELENQGLTDAHVHVGWYLDGYHAPGDVWQSVVAAGIGEIYVSSTSTCAERYKLVVREMRELRRLGGERIHPLLWLTPRMLRTWGLRYMLRSKVKWQGVKMHWEAHREWFYNRKLVAQALAVTRQLQVPLLLHTGQFKECHAAVFEPLVAQHGDITFILAHGRPIEETLRLLSRYENVYADTAFMPVGDVLRLVEAGFGSRVLFGTDAPINLLFYKDLTTTEYLRRTIQELQRTIGEAAFRQLATQNVRRAYNTLK